MWAIKFLKGPLKGQTSEIKSSELKLGRGADCDIRLEGPGISKSHARILISETELIIQDLDSTNGTFVNGVKVKSRPLKKGDRISIQGHIFEIVNPATALHLPIQGSPQKETFLPVYSGGAALDLGSLEQHEYGAPQSAPQAEGHYNPRNFLDVVRHYFETVVLPGVYRLAQIMEFKWVIGLFVGAYVILVTGLSVIPMVQITKSSIEKESQRRALTIAQGLADRYTIALTNGTSGSFNTRFAEREEGVTAAFILSAQDGSILAPVSRSGAYANEPFVHTARKKETELVQQIDSETIGASVPIKTYDPETGLQTTKAYGMVVYNMGSLAVDDGRVISLFVQVLGIAILIGLILYVFLYKLIEAPIIQINSSLDKALRDSTHSIETPYLFPLLNKLALNINSALTRQSDGLQTDNQKDYYTEAQHLVRIMSSPAMAISHNMNIIAVNSYMAEALNIALTQIDNSPVHNMGDDNVSSVIQELVAQAQAQPFNIHTSQVHFNNEIWEMSLTTLTDGYKVECYIVSLNKNNFDGGLL